MLPVQLVAVGGVQSQLEHVRVSSTPAKYTFWLSYAPAGQARLPRW